MIHATIHRGEILYRGAIIRPAHAKRLAEQFRWSQRNHPWFADEAAEIAGQLEAALKQTQLEHV